MKKGADDKRREKSFEVGEWVWLKLHKYKQQSLAVRTNFKLSKKYYGPYQITAKVGVVAYQLALPAHPYSYCVCVLPAIIGRLYFSFDSMVKAWIINSISKDIVDNFMYFPSSQALWNELETRYGTSCGPQIYQIQRTMSTIQQGNDPVSHYYGVEHVAGNMFKSVPKADAIFLKVIAIESGIIAMPDTIASKKCNFEVDVFMMAQDPGGKERKQHEFLQLAKAAGFKGIKYQCHARNFWVIEFFK
ncbi:caffeic acid 3-O-methyltransferase-like [Senna tora]|uniref:Caffeic acid 3-O-methyltransferase-like n=1 Tax=Senna tora TaxID=362788 RepID=A0A835CIQ4_9FABA|nr:caffeic acid 3-O-methyltransferase-like [Senna tora]